MKTDSPNSLSLATEELYHAFAHYELRAHVLGCSHCVTAADERQLHAAPLRNLQSEDLSRFAFKAMTTWGSVDDFRHFLPRILELVTAEGTTWIEAEVALGKLKYGNWNTWPCPEQNAVRSFLRAMWVDVLSRYPHPLDADTCLCSIGQAEDDLSWYVGAWNITTSASAADHFAEFLEYNLPSNKQISRHSWKLGNSFWTSRSDQACQVANWVVASARVTELERAFFTFGSTDTEMAQRLSGAFDQLTLIRQVTGAARNRLPGWSGAREPGEHEVGPYSARRCCCKFPNFVWLC